MVVANRLAENSAVYPKNIELNDAEKVIEAPL
jgi:hypothetical protein